MYIDASLYTLVQCPVCGWTGYPPDRKQTGAEACCPACDQPIPSLNTE
jgi:hypothetical protein